jgi:uncharacterized protein YheU (UPF0270 family)
MMRIETEEGFIWTIPHPTDRDLITVASRDYGTLESMIESIELQGTREGEDYDDLAIRLNEELGYFEMLLDRGTLILWFEFEMLNYQQHIEGN